MDEYISANAVKHVFENSFLERSLELQISHCDHYELLPCFKKWLPNNQPILEAGCGSGRWVIWFVRQGWKAVGLDWSHNLISRARSQYPNAQFEVGDMRSMPFGDNQFGSIVSLGAIEHTVEGPRQSLREYFRVLRPGGVATITVPFLSAARKLSTITTRLTDRMKNINAIRRAYGKAAVDNRSFDVIRRLALPGYSADYCIDDGSWAFYQYHFSRRQMRDFLRTSGFAIEEEFVDFGDEGVLHNFGSLAGRYDYEEACVTFTMIGKWIRKAIPLSQVGHMLCYVVRSNK